MGGDRLTQQHDIANAADKAQPDVVDAVVQRPLEIRPILVGQARCTESDSRQIHALLAADQPRLHDFANDSSGLRVLFDDPQGNNAIGQQNAIARTHIVDQRLVCADELRGIGIDARGRCVAHELNQRTLSQPQPFFGKDAESNLRSGQVAEDANRVSLLARNLSDPSDDLLEPRMTTVCEVQPKQIDSRCNQLRQLLNRSRSRPHCRDDLRLDQSAFHVRPMQKVHSNSLPKRRRDREFGSATKHDFKNTNKYRASSLNRVGNAPRVV